MTMTCHSKEIWKDIQGYEGMYQVSSHGRVKSFKKNKVKILKPQMHYKGYEFVTLHKNGIGEKCKVHRLVAKAFIPNPNNYPVVNHKDENKSNNNVENLEWCTVSYNNIYNGKAVKIGKIHNKKVKCITTNEIFNSVKEAREYFDIKGVSAISECCNGKRKTAGIHPISKEKLEWEYYEN